MSALEEHEPIEEAAARWALRTRDVTSLEDEAALVAWLAEDPAHLDAYRRARSAWALIGEEAGAPELLAMRRDALARAHRAGGRRFGGVRVDRRAIAAALVGLVAAPVGTAWWLNSRKAEEADFQTGLGERRTVALSDGSRVTLDAMTLVKTTFTPGRRRVQLIAGRAHFEVAKDADRPMTVTAGPRTVTALGTAFTVERERETTLVLLTEGKVSVADLGADAPFAVMRPGEELTLPDDGRRRLRKGVDAARALAWREGRLVFDDVALEDAASRMNRYSARPIVVADAEARDLRISGVFKAGDSPAFVDALQAYFGVRAQSDDTAIVVRSKD